MRAVDDVRGAGNAADDSSDNPAFGADSVRIAAGIDISASLCKSDTASEVNRDRSIGIGSCDRTAVGAVVDAARACGG